MNEQKLAIVCSELAKDEAAIVDENDLGRFLSGEPKKKKHTVL